MKKANTNIIRIDAHQHFWVTERGDYEWLSPALGELYKDFMPDDLVVILKSENITGTILVQAAETNQETDFLLDLAEKTDFVMGVIGWIDMASEYATSRLQTLVKNPYFKGIRPMIQDTPDKNWMLEPTLTPTFNMLIEHGLCFDALVKSDHLDALNTLLKRHPELKVVIDHGAKPDIANNSFDSWSKKISQTALNTNVYCKLSGLFTEAGENIDLVTIEPYVDHLITSFGSDRIMWGSDWPVINLKSSYKNWAQVCETYLSRLDIDSQKAIWSNTARKFYSLEPL